MSTGLTAIPGGLSQGGATVRLGDKTYEVVAQRKARLRRRLPQAFSLDQASLDAEAGWSGLLDLLDKNSYSLLKVFIPDIMPEWEFNGFSSEADWKADRYQEDADHSPTWPQVTEAARICAEINGLDLVKHLKNLVSPELIRAFLTSQVADFLTETSPSLSATSTPDTPSTTTTTSPPTQVDLEVQESAVSPSPESSASLNHGRDGVPTSVTN